MKNELVKKIREVAKKAGRILAVPVAALSIGYAGLAAPQKANADGFVEGSIGANIPYDSVINNTFGNGGIIGVEVGYKTKSDFRFSLEINYSGNSKTHDTNTLPTISSEIDSLDNLSVQWRFAKGFDAGSGFYPYFGVDTSYNSFSAKADVTVTYGPGTSGTTTASTTLFGFGSFVGVRQEGIFGDKDMYSDLELSVESIPVPNPVQGGAQNLGTAMLKVGLGYNF